MIRIQANLIGARDLSGVSQALQDPGDGLIAAGRALRDTIVGWLRLKNALEPNQLGGQRTNFWNAVAASVTQPALQGNSQVVIDITHPAFAQKLYGGPIVPKLHEWLTIPANARAYGKPARAFNLKFRLARDPGRNGQWRPALVLAAPAKKAQRRKRSEDVESGRKLRFDRDLVMYWLARRVYQDPWPDCLPTQEGLEETARLGFEPWLIMKLKHAQSRPAH
jgi:hypothetical protein